MADWLASIYSELDQAADAAWPQMVRDFGLPEKKWSFQRLSRRDDPNIASLSQLVSHPDAGQFVYRFQLRPWSEERFAEHSRLQKQAFDRFPHSPTHSMPRPVFSDSARQVSLTEFCSGRTLDAEARSHAPGSAEQLDLIRRAGQWLDTYHRCCPVEARAFQPKFTQRYYNGMRDKIRSGARKVAAQPLIMRGIAHLNEVAPAFADRQTVAAVQHGDFHMRNLLVNGPRMVGLDVSGDGLTPVGHDVARFLLDYVCVCRQVGEVPEGQVVPPDAMEAFFDGYKIVGPEDPSVQFLLFARILAALQHVQPRPKDRTQGKKRTLNQVRPIGWNAFKTHAQKNSDAGSQNTITFFLTPQSVERAKSGQHLVVNTMRNVADACGLQVSVKRNNQRNRDQVDPSARSLVHMSNPVGPRGLVFRRMYGGDFYAIEASPERWHWDVAAKQFDPETVDMRAATAFFEHWRHRMHGACTDAPTDEGFIYMPLQGKLLQHRSFQFASPIDMIRQTLAQTNLPIRLTLHPNENYAQGQHDALAQLVEANARLTCDDLPMEDALSRCRYVVTENSSAAFHALFFRKPAILFARSDFHHLCLSADTTGVFEQIGSVRPEFEKYLYWYWFQNGLDLSSSDAAQIVRDRLNTLGWALPPKVGGEV